MMLDKYLPLGTVVLLKDGKKRLMITGYCCTTPDNKTYDYTGCLFPEGVVTADKILMFNHDQIDRIFHLGLIDEQSEKINAYLKANFDKKNN